MIRRPGLAVLLGTALLLTALMVGCGDEDDDPVEAGAGSDLVEDAPSSGGDERSDQGATSRVEVELLGDSYSPSEIDAPGSEVTLVLDNTSAAEHTFTIDDLDIDEEIDPGSTTEVVVDVPSNGALSFYCRFHESSGMRGTITGKGSSDATTSTPETTVTTPDARDGSGYGY